MADTTFTDGATPIVADWLNDVNDAVYGTTTGSWTPTIWDTSASDSEGQTYSAQYGVYTKIGKLVIVNGYIGVTSTGTLTAGDQAFIGGLPFTNGSTSFGAMNVGYASGLALPTAGDVVSGLISGNNSFISLRNWDDVSGVTKLLISEFNLGFVSFQATYYTD